MQWIPAYAGITGEALRSTFPTSAGRTFLPPVRPLASRHGRLLVGKEDAAPLRSGPLRSSFIALSVGVRTVVAPWSAAG